MPKEGESACEPKAREALMGSMKRREGRRGRENGVPNLQKPTEPEQRHRSDTAPSTMHTATDTTKGSQGTTGGLGLPCRSASGRIVSLCVLSLPAQRCQGQGVRRVAVSGSTHVHRTSVAYRWARRRVFKRGGRGSSFVDEMVLRRSSRAESNKINSVLEEQLVLWVFRWLERL